MRRIRFATIAVFGLGLFVAVAVGITLYLSGAAGVRSTQTLLAQQAEAQLDVLENRLDTLLKPVGVQGEWIERAFADGTADPSHVDRLDAFMQGVIGATPQVSTLIFISPDAHARRWSRGTRKATTEDWSQRTNVVEFVSLDRGRTDSSWRAPIRGRLSGAAVLLHDNPLRHDGRYLGVLVQVVPVAALSRDFAMAGSESGLTPFILYGGDRVLAHPRLTQPPKSDEAPLPTVAEFGDPALAEFLRPNTGRPFELRRVTRAQATSAQVGDSSYLYFSRRIERFGDVPLTLGAYVSMDRRHDDEMQRLLQALFAGLGVLVAAAIAAGWAGVKLSEPVQELARASKAVEEGELEDIPELKGSAIAEFDDASRSFNRMVRGLHERELYRRTLGRFVSKEVARRLMKGGGKLQPVEAAATVLVCDIEGFTPLTKSLGPGGVVEFLNAYFQVMVSILEKHDGTVTQFQGDAILAVFNVPVENPEHARHAVEAAIEMIRAAAQGDFAGVKVAVRIGICTGDLIAGAVGARGRLTYTVHGNVVNIAARLEELNKARGTRILVAESTARLCPPGLLREIGEVTVRGYGERVRVYTAVSS